MMTPKEAEAARAAEAAARPALAPPAATDVTIRPVVTDATTACRCRRPAPKADGESTPRCATCGAEIPREWLQEHGNSVDPLGFVIRRLPDLPVGSAVRRDVNGISVRFKRTVDGWKPEFGRR